jgi:hypothetical protein
MPENNTFTIEMDRVKARLVMSVHYVNKFVSFSLMSSDIAPDDMLLILPESMYQVCEPGNEYNYFKQMRKPYAVWTVSCGLRDLVEATSIFLNDIRVVCRIFSSKDYLDGELYKKIVEEESEKFLDKGLPDKLSTLIEEYGLNLTFAEFIFSLNQARNCLVHRFGRVGKRDVNKDNMLVVKFIQVKPSITRDDGRVEDLKIPGTYKGSEMERIRPNRLIEKEFKLGDTVLFSNAEFGGICMTLLAFADEIVREAENYGRRQGIVFKKEQEN